MCLAMCACCIIDSMQRREGLRSRGMHVPSVIQVCVSSGEESHSPSFFGSGGARCTIGEAPCPDSSHGEAAGWQAGPLRFISQTKTRFS